MNDRNLDDQLVKKIAELLFSEDYDSVKRILEERPDYLHAIVMQKTWLMMMASEGKLEFCKLLVEHGVDVNKTFEMFDDPNNVRTALDHAAGKPEFAEYLRSVGAKHASEL